MSNRSDICRRHWAQGRAHGLSVIELIGRWGETCGMPWCDNLAREIDHDHGCCGRSPRCGRCARAIVCVSCNRLIARFEAGDLAPRQVGASAWRYLIEYVLGWRLAREAMPA